MCSSVVYTCLMCSSLFPFVSLCPLRRSFACRKWLGRCRHRRKLCNVKSGTRLLATHTRDMCLLNTLNHYRYSLRRRTTVANTWHIAVHPITAIPHSLIGSAILREFLQVRIGVYFHVLLSRTFSSCIRVSGRYVQARTGSVSPRYTKPNAATPSRPKELYECQHCLLWFGHLSLLRYNEVVRWKLINA